AYAKRDMTEVNGKASIALRIALITGVPMSVVLAASSEQIIGFLFSTVDGWEIAGLLTLSAIFQIVMMTSGAILVGLGQTKAPMIHTFIGIAVKLAGGYLLAPWLGIYGILAATMLCFIVIMLLNLIVLKRTVNYKILG